MRIGIIKLGAKGDIIRTLPILIGIKKKYPESEIIWITKKESEDILKTSPYINKIITLPIPKNLNFDILYNFDIENLATELINNIKSEEKYGFYLNGGYPSAINFSAEYYLNTVFDDELKKDNKKTYQEMIFEIAELPYNKEYHPLYLTDYDKKYGENFLKDNNIKKGKILGIHIGSSNRWPSKKWHLDNIKEFIIKSKSQNYEIIIFGGPEEKEDINKLFESLKNSDISLYKNDIYNTDKEFFSLVNICNKIVTGDSFALHVAIALNIPTLALFFCTNPNEIESYEILKKIISPMLYQFFPEKSDEYSEELTKSISAQEVFNDL
ncbi:MAG: glycosyltransferase family 9 protein [Nanoarchaeota archaeon]